MTMLRIPPPTNEDKLPHDRAVWRSGVPDQPVANHQVSVDHGGGAIEQTRGELVDWTRVRRWRFGHAPETRP